MTVIDFPGQLALDGLPEPPTEPEPPPTDEASGRDTRPSCGRCDARWSGTRTAHCSAVGCHQTFSGVGGFDAHRRNGHCLRPASLGMSLLAGRQYDCWGYPAEDAEAEAA